MGRVTRESREKRKRSGVWLKVKDDGEKDSDGSSVIIGWVNVFDRALFEQYVHYGQINDDETKRFTCTTKTNCPICVLKRYANDLLENDVDGGVVLYGDVDLDALTDDKSFKNKYCFSKKQFQAVIPFVVARPDGIFSEDSPVNIIQGPMTMIDGIEAEIDSLKKFGNVEYWDEPCALKVSIKQEKNRWKYSVGQFPQMKLIDEYRDAVFADPRDYEIDCDEITKDGDAQEMLEFLEGVWTNEDHPFSDFVQFGGWDYSKAKKERKRLVRRTRKKEEKKEESKEELVCDNSECEMFGQVVNSKFCHECGVKAKPKSERKVRKKVAKEKKEEVECPSCKDMVTPTSEGLCPACDQELDVE